MVTAEGLADHPFVLATLRRAVGMKYLLLVLDSTLRFVERALLITDEVDLACYETLSPSPFPAPELSQEEPGQLGSPVLEPAASDRSSPAWELPQSPLSLEAPSSSSVAEGGLMQCGDELLAAESAVDMLFPDFLLDSVSPVRDPLPSPPLSPGDWIDLSRYDSDQEQPESNFCLDCPPFPGVDCASCDYHRAEQGDPSVFCSLCYMRSTF